MATGRELAGRRVLVVEDDFLVASDIELIPTEHGCAAVELAPDPGRALAYARGDGLDAAVLDAKLGERTAAPMTAALRARGVPFVVVGGDDGAALDPALRRAPRVGKPFATAGLVATLGRALG